MSEVTKQDIAEVHKRIDGMVEKQNETNILLTEVKTTLKLLPKVPERPCNELKEHLKSHDKAKQAWQRPTVRVIADLIKMAIVATVTWLFLRKE